MKPSHRLAVALVVTLGPLAAACVSNSTNPSPGPSDSGSGSGSGSSGSGSGSGSGSSGSGSSSSGSGSSSGSSSGGGTDDGGGGDGGGGGACSWTVTGGVSANGTCLAAGAYANGSLNFGLTEPTENTANEFGFSLFLGPDAAAFQPGTYTTANVLEAAGEYVSVVGTSVKALDYSDSDGGADGGFTLVITSVGTEVTIDGGIVWEAPHGTLSVTLSPKTGATLPGTGTATF